MKLLSALAATIRIIASGVILLALGAILFWPVPVSVPSHSDFETHEIPSLALQAVESSFNNNDQLYHEAARVLLSTHSSESLVEWHLNSIVLTIRLRVLLGQKRTSVFLGRNMYFGAGSYGVLQASQRVFCKEAEKLDLGEAASLAALSINPQMIRNIERWRDGRDRILTRMVEKGAIGRAEADAATAQPIFSCL